VNVGGKPGEKEVITGGQFVGPDNKMIQVNVGDGLQQMEGGKPWTIVKMDNENVSYKLPESPAIYKMKRSVLNDYLKTGRMTVIAKVPTPQPEAKEFSEDGFVKNGRTQENETISQWSSIFDYLDERDNKYKSVDDDGRKKAVSSIKINNRATEFQLNDGNVINLEDNATYQTLLATGKINIGTKITLKVDTETLEFQDVESYETRTTTSRNRSHYFSGNKIKDQQIDNFPVAIYATVDGKEVKLGYLPQLKWVMARYENKQSERFGKSINIADQLTAPDGSITTGNVNAQGLELTRLRTQILERHNQDPKFTYETEVNGKSNGTMRFRVGKDKKALRPLAESMGPGTPLGIIRGGMIHMNKMGDKVDISDPEYMSFFDPEKNMEGWVVAIIPTPTGGKMITYVAPSTLKDKHADLVLEAYKAFWSLKKQKGVYDTASTEFKLVSAIYEANGSRFKQGYEVSFTQLKKYVNQNIAFLSGRPYENINKGASQLNITDEGQMSLWVSDTGEKARDSVFASNADELSQDNRQEMFKSGLSKVYYNTKLDSINVEGKRKFLSFSNGKVMVTEKTYNEYQMDHLQTNLIGRPSDPADLNKEWIYFDNPLVTFTFVDLNKPMKNNKAAKNASPFYNAQVDNDTTGLQATKEDVEETQKASKTTATSDIKRIQKLPFQERIPALINAGIIKEVYQYGNRPVVVVNINGELLPFYRSSNGTSGKEKGQWFPMFGFGKSKSTDNEPQWLIKPSIKDLENNLNSNAIKEFSDIIKSTLNWEHSFDTESLNNPFFKPFVTFKTDEQGFNEKIFGKKDLGVVNDGKTNYAHIDSIVNKINAKYDASLKNQPQPQQPTTQAQKIDIYAQAAAIGETLANDDSFDDDALSGYIDEDDLFSIKRTIDQSNLKTNCN
jgi:hypothetical protein